jgi:hypothetical protein
VRFTRVQYDAAIEALVAAKQQLVPDGHCCRICHDTGHQAWECGHNPLYAMSVCGPLATCAIELHDRLHTIEESMNDSDQMEALMDWREDVHEFLHHAGGWNIGMGERVGPAHVVMIQASNEGAVL